MNLLIIDDEPLIHVSIEYSIRETPSSEDIAVFHAYNGTEMLQKIKETPMDLALVDIRMPGLTGLEAIQQAREVSPQTLYYIMSGFNEFEYARQAIHLNVAEYLLKPLEPDVLIQVLEQAREVCRKRQNQAREAFRGWIAGILQDQNVKYLFNESYYAAMILLTYDGGRPSVSFPGTQTQEPLFPIPDFVRANHDLILSYPCDEGILLMAYSQNINQIHDLLRSIPSRELSPGTTAFVSSVSNDPDRLAEQIRRLRAFSPNRVFHGIERRYDSSVLPAASEAQTDRARLWIALRNALLEENYTQYMLLLSRLSATQKNEETALLSLTKFAFALTGAHTAPISTYARLIEYLSAAGEELISQNKSIDRIDAVLQYVQEHYCQNISLGELAEKFGLTPNYLSTLLHNRLQMRFTDYLTSLRMTKAKELLLTSSLSVKEITQSVGYYSQSHFTKLFLEKEGCSPAEFRAGHGHIES